MTLRTYLDANRPAWRDDTDADVLAWLLADVTVYVDVSWLDLSMWVAQYNLRPALKAAATSGTDAQQTAAQHILDCIAAGQPLYGSDSRVRTAIASAIPAGAARAALIAMATSSAPRWHAARPLTLSSGQPLPDGPGLAHIAEERL